MAVCTTETARIVCVSVVGTLLLFPLLLLFFFFLLLAPQLLSSDCRVLVVEGLFRRDCNAILDLSFSVINLLLSCVCMCVLFSCILGDFFVVGSS